MWLVDASRGTLVGAAPEAKSIIMGYRWGDYFSRFITTTLNAVTLLFFGGIEQTPGTRLNMPMQSV